RLVIVGHGLVARQVRGPSGPGRAPEQGVVLLRRYRCRACEAVLVVGPRGLLRRRWYSAGSVGLALLGYGEGESSASVRARMSPSRTVGGSAVEHWVTLRRWVEAVRDGVLFDVSGLMGLAPRSVARQVAQVLAARGGRELGGPIIQQARAHLLTSTPRATAALLELLVSCEASLTALVPTQAE
ncbi:MAG: hypothetical protein ABI488_16175, partial [Polyangiaceae bacterium]